MKLSSIRRRWWLLALVLVIGGLAGFGHFMAVSLRGEAESAGVEADRPAFRTVACFGFVELQNSIRKLNPTVPGRVAEVLVKEGDSVAAGAPLIRLDDTLARGRIDEAQANLDMARTEQEKARRLPEEHRITIQQAEDAIKAAKAQQNAAQQVLRLKEEQERKGVLPNGTEQVIIAREELQKAQANVRAREDDLNKLKLNNPNIAVQIANTNVYRAELALKQAKDALAEYTVTAPTSGTVLQVSVAPGDTIGAMTQQSAVEFGPDSPRIIRANVEQAFAALVTEGLEAKIEDDTHVAGTWTGRVKYVSDRFTQKRPSVSEPLQFSDVRTMECLIELDPGQRPLRLGQRVLVIIEVPVR